MLAQSCHIISHGSDAAAPPSTARCTARSRGRSAPGRWKPGDRLPSEAELVRRFGASRITVGRAVRDLQLAGLVERRAGSGTYVGPPSAPAGSTRSGC